MYNIEELNVRLLSELKEIAEELGVKNYKKLAKKDIIYKILDQQAITPETDMPEKKPVAKESKPSTARSTNKSANKSTNKRADKGSKKPSIPKRENVTSTPASEAGEGEMFESFNVKMEGGAKKNTESKDEPRREKSRDHGPRDKDRKDHKSEHKNKKNNIKDFDGLKLALDHE